MKKYKDVSKTAKQFSDFILSEYKEGNNGDTKAEVISEHLYKWLEGVYSIGFTKKVIDQIYAQIGLLHNDVDVNIEAINNYPGDYRVIIDWEITKD